MNLSRQFISGPADFVSFLSLGFVAAGILILLALSRVKSFRERSERTCSVTAYTLFALNVAIFLIIAVGYIFLLNLKIESGFWFLWEVLWLLSVVSLQSILPALAIVVFAWAVVGKLKLGYRQRTLLLAIATVAFVAINAATESSLLLAFKKAAISATPAVVNMQFNVAGQTLPDEPLLDLNGKQVQIRDQFGDAKLTLVVFWASYDTPWSPNIPIAKAIHTEFADKGVLVIGVNEGEPVKEVKTFVAKEALAFPVFCDTNAKFFQRLGVAGSVEQILVVDSTGKVLQQLENEQKTAKKVADLLRQFAAANPSSDGHGAKE